MKKSNVQTRRGDESSEIYLCCNAATTRRKTGCHVMRFRPQQLEVKKLFSTSQPLSNSG